MKPIDEDCTRRFVEMLTGHQRKLYAYICTLMFGDSGAADVLQDTNLDLWARAGEYDFERPFLPWALAFARQRVLAYRKSRSRSRLVFSDEIIECVDQSCIALASDADVRMTALKKCLKKLSSEQADLVRERYVTKTSVRLIAAQLGDTAQNISCRLHRIRKQLAGCVERTIAMEER